MNTPNLERELEDFVHLIGDGWLTEAFDLKDPEKLLDLIERAESDIRKELQALITQHTDRARVDELKYIAQITESNRLKERFPTLLEEAVDERIAHIKSKEKS